MGNICNNGGHKDDQNSSTSDTLAKNFPVCQFTIKNLCQLSLVMGNYRCHRSETLLIITQNDYLQYCQQLRQYAQNFNAVIEHINVQRKKLLFVSTSRNCPYKKVQLCIMPIYNSLEFQTYFQQFQNMIQQILSYNSDLTLQLSYTSDNLNGLPNQTLMSIFLKYISSQVNKPLKISIISNEMKLLNMVRYQVVKLENYTINMFNFDMHA